MCNWKSSQIWLDNLVWTGAKSYLSEEMQPWYAKIDGCAVKAGDTKTAYSLGGGKFSTLDIFRSKTEAQRADLYIDSLAAFATIEKAGHMGEEYQD